MSSDKNNIYSIYLKLRSKLASSVLGIVPPAEVEDIVQEAYVKICQRQHVDYIQSPQSFLYKTVRNLALDHQKRAETRLADSIEDFDLLVPEGHSSEDEIFKKVASDESFGLFCEAVRSLSAQCRRAFVLKKVYGYSQKEIAKEMDISENTVENHIAQGIKKCTQFMQRYGESYGKRSQQKTEARILSSVRKGGPDHD